MFTTSTAHSFEVDTFIGSVASVGAFLSREYFEIVSFQISENSL